MLTTVKLLGPLGQRFGREFQLDINSPREAMQLLAVNLAGFHQYLIDSHEQGLGYRVVDHRGLAWQGDRAEEELDYPVGQAVLIIVPAVYGSGGPLFRILAGVALVGVGLFTGFTPLALVGASLILGGIGQLLAPNPNNKDRQKQSYFFNGPINTTNQGNPVPLCYGRLIVGSHVISAGITLDKIIPAEQTYNVNPSGGNETTRLSNDPASDDFYIEQVNGPTGTYPDIPSARETVRWYCSGGVCYVTTDPAAAYATKSECEAALVKQFEGGGQCSGVAYLVDYVCTQPKPDGSPPKVDSGTAGPYTGPITAVYAVQNRNSCSSTESEQMFVEHAGGLSNPAEAGGGGIVIVCTPFTWTFSVRRADGTSQADDVAQCGDPPLTCP